MLNRRFESIANQITCRYRGDKQDDDVTLLQDDLRLEQCNSSLRPDDYTDFTPSLLIS